MFCACNMGDISTRETIAARVIELAGAGERSRDLARRSLRGPTAAPDADVGLASSPFRKQPAPH